MAPDSLNSAVSPLPCTALNCQLDLSVVPEQIIEIAEAAGAAILEIYNSGEGSWDVQRKWDNSPLTAADSKANAIICAELNRISPHIPIVSEETKLIPFNVRKNYVYWWCVDPLDGTKEFLKRNGQFTVNIALVKGNRPILGVVHTPCLGKTYWGVKGRGAFLRESNRSESGNDRQIFAAEFSEEDEGLVIAGSSSHATAEGDAFVKKFKSPKVVVMGSSLKFMLVAEGEAHIYPRLGLTSEWDTCASQIIVEEAGGEVLRYPELTPLSYGKEDILNPLFIVYGARKK